MPLKTILDYRKTDDDMVYTADCSAMSASVWTALSKPTVHARVIFLELHCLHNSFSLFFARSQLYRGFQVAWHKNHCRFVHAPNSTPPPPHTHQKCEHAWNVTGFSCQATWNSLYQWYRARSTYMDVHCMVWNWTGFLIQTGDTWPAVYVYIVVVIGAWLMTCIHALNLHPPLNRTYTSFCTWHKHTITVQHDWSQMQTIYSSTQ